MTENEKLMLDMLERLYIELHEHNARVEFPREALESELGSLIAKIKRTTYDHKAAKRDRAKLKKRYGKPDSVKLKELREAIKNFAMEQLGSMLIEDMF